MRQILRGKGLAVQKVKRDTLVVSRVPFFKFCNGLLPMQHVQIADISHVHPHGLL